MSIVSLRPPRGWCAPYVGAPYVLGGESPAGWDCWGLLVYLGREVLGWTAPELAEPWPRHTGRSARAALFAEHARGWRRIAGGATRPAGVLFAARGGLPIHVGLSDGYGGVLHVLDETATVLEPLAAVKVPIEGFYVPL